MRLSVIFLLLIFCTDIYAQSVINGGFDNGSNGWNNDCNCTSEANCMEINPETVYGGSVPSNLVAEIDGHNNASTTVDDRILCQAIPCFIIGRTYILSFRAARRTSSITPDPASIQVEIEGTTLSEEIIRTGAFNWIEESFTFVATQNIHLITFKPNFRGSFGMLIDDITIEVETNLSADMAGPYCENDFIEALQAQPIGGQWSGPGVSLNGVFNPSAAGPGSHVIQYGFEVGIGCPAEQVTIIIDVNENISATIEDVTSICENTGPFLLEASPSGGIWEGAVLDSLFDPSSIGVGIHQINYSLNGPCSVSDQIEIEVLAAPSPSIIDPGLLCEGSGIIQLTSDPSGGTWGQKAAPDGTINSNILGVGQHLVSYEYTNSGGCSEKVEITIEIVADPVIEIKTIDAICFGSDPLQLDAMPNNGTWSGAASPTGSIDPFILSPGFHQVFYEVSDANGCTASIDFEIEILALPELRIEQIPTLCENDLPYNVDYEPLGGTWSLELDQSGTIYPNVLGPGLYQASYNYTDQNGCSNIDYLDIEILAIPTIEIEAISDICQNSDPVQLIASPNGGIWSGDLNSTGLITPSSLDPGSYEVVYTVVSDDGCENMLNAFYEIIEVAQIEIQSQESYCLEDLNQTLFANPAGGLWSGDVNADGSFNPEQIGTGDYTAIYSYESQNCLVMDSVTFSVVAPETIDFNNDIFCQNSGLVQLSAMPQGGVWSGSIVTSNGGINTELLTAGVYPVEYTIILTQASGPDCERTEILDITIVEAVSAGEGPVSIQLCNDGSTIDLFEELEGATPGGLWTDQSANTTTNFSDGILDTDNLEAGTYLFQYEVFGTAPCGDDAQELIINIENPVQAGNVIGPFSICESDPSEINLFDLIENYDEGGIWNTLPPLPLSTLDTSVVSLELLLPGIYHFEYFMSTQGICQEDQLVVEIEILELPLADAGVAQELNCNVREVSLGGSSSTGSNITYNWTGNVENSIDAITMTSDSGIYTLTVLDTVTGCFSTDKVTVVDFGTPPILSAQSFNVSCFGFNDGQILVNQVSEGTPPFTYSLNGIEVSETDLVNLFPGQYTFEVIDANGCMDFLEFDIQEPEELDVFLISSASAENNLISYGDSIQLNASVNGVFDSIAWSSNSDLIPCDNQISVDDCLSIWVTPESSTTYQFSVFSEIGCFDEAFLTIEVEKEIKIYIPNVFTPNGDFVNDVFRIYTNKNIEQVFSLQIYDRWGTLVFEQFNFQPDDPEGSWNGEFMGQSLNSGVFVYHAEIHFKDGSSQRFKGDVTILK